MKMPIIVFLIFLFGVLCVDTNRWNGNWGNELFDEVSFQGDNPKKANNEIDIKEVPWQVAIVDVDNDYLWSGAIINKKWIITRSKYMHTNTGKFERWNEFSNTHLKDIFVRSGSSFHNHSGCRHEVTDKILHPKFSNKGYMDFNYILLSVLPYFEFNDVTRPPKELSKVTNPAIGLKLVATGYNTDEATKFRLRKYFVTITDRGNCTHESWGTLDESSLCTLVNTGSDLIFRSILSDVGKGILYGINTGYNINLNNVVFNNIGFVKDWIEERTRISN